MFKELSIVTSGKSEFIDITKKIETIIQNIKVQEGTLILFVPHTTSAVTINENADPDVNYPIPKGRGL